MSSKEIIDLVIKKAVEESKANVQEFARELESYRLKQNTIPMTTKRLEQKKITAVKLKCLHYATVIITPEITPEKYIKTAKDLAKWVLSPS